LVAALEPYGLEVGRQMVMTALAVAALLALTGPAAALTRAPVTGAVDPAIRQAKSPRDRLPARLYQGRSPVRGMEPGSKA
jgi:hypothetical protein